MPLVPLVVVVVLFPGIRILMPCDLPREGDEEDMVGILLMACDPNLFNPDACLSNIWKLLLFCWFCPPGLPPSIDTPLSAPLLMAGTSSFGGGGGGVVDDSDPASAAAVVPLLDSSRWSAAALCVFFCA